MSSALFLLNYKFLRPSYFEKIGGTGRTDRVQQLMLSSMPEHHELLVLTLQRYQEYF